MVGADAELQKQLITYYHNEAIGGHSRVYVTTKKFTAVFHWKGLKKMSIISHPFNASQVAQVFLDGVYKLLGSPDAIAIGVMKFHLKRTQDRMKSQADKHKTDRQYAVGDWVYLKHQPHRQVSVRQGQQRKLSTKYHGPFVIEEMIGELREDGLLASMPMAILEKMLGKVAQSASDVCVDLVDKQTHKISWEIYVDLIARFPDFDANS
nr:reverse transcriptase [Tanacetum cinerariifolium]